MTEIERLMSELREAVKAEMVENVKAWWAENGHGYVEHDDVEGAASDLIITLEQS